MNMDSWYDLLVRELTDLDRAKELRQDAEAQIASNDTEDDPVTPSTGPPKPT
jgi:hypothetical protein